jgi:hypothetical protein
VLIVVDRSIDVTAKVTNNVEYATIIITSKATKSAPDASKFKKIKNFKKKRKN